MLRSGSHERLNGPALFPRGFAERADAVVPDRGRNDKSLGIVHYKRLKRARWTFDHCFATFDQVQDIDAAGSTMCRGARKPMAASLYKLAFVESGLLLSPSRARTKRRDLIYQVTTHPLCRAIPLDIRFAMTKVNRPGQPVQAEASPVPQLESENEGGGADLEHHTVFSRAVDSTGGAEVIDLFFCMPNGYVNPPPE